MENKDKTSTGSDEIDMAGFLNSIGKGFIRIGDNLLYTLASLRNILIDFKFFFILIAIAGVSAAVVYHVFLRRDLYKSTMVLNCSYLNTQFIENTIQNLNLLTKEKEREGLSQELAIDFEIAKGIDEFEFEPFVSEDDKVQVEVLKEQLSNISIENKQGLENVLKQLQFNNRNSFRITVFVYDPKVIKPLETALLNYFRNNEFIKRRIEINKQTLTRRREKLINESQKLDSLKKVLFKNYQAMNTTSKGSNNVFLGDEKLTNPLDVFAQDLQINNDILTIEEELYINPDFEVVEGFVTSKQPANLNLTQNIIIALTLAILFGYVFIGFWKFNQLLDKYETKEIKT